MCRRKAQLLRWLRPYRPWTMALWTRHPNAATSTRRAPILGQLDDTTILGQLDDTTILGQLDDTTSLGQLDEKPTILGQLLTTNQ